MDERVVLLLWIFYVFVLSCVCYVLCASVYMCFVVTFWERADLLALVCGVYCDRVLCFFNTVQLAALRSVVGAFPGHIHLLYELSNILESLSLDVEYFIQQNLDL